MQAESPLKLFEIILGTFFQVIVNEAGLIVERRYRRRGRSVWCYE